MKKSILLLTAIILISCGNREEKTSADTLFLKTNTVNYGNLKFSNVTEYQNFLIQEGYSEEAAGLIAKTEFKLISEGAEYNALMED